MPTTQDAYVGKSLFLSFFFFLVSLFTNNSNSYTVLFHPYSGLHTSCQHENSPSHDIVWLSDSCLKQQLLVILSTITFSCFVFSQCRINKVHFFFSISGIVAVYKEHVRMKRQSCTPGPVMLRPLFYLKVGCPLCKI